MINRRPTYIQTYTGRPNFNPNFYQRRTGTASPRRLSAKYTQARNVFFLSVRVGNFFVFILFCRLHGLVANQAGASQLLSSVGYFAFSTLYSHYGNVLALETPEIKDLWINTKLRRWNYHHRIAPWKVVQWTLFTRSCGNLLENIRFLVESRWTIYHSCLYDG